MKFIPLKSMFMLFLLLIISETVSSQSIAFECTAEGTCHGKELVTTGVYSVSVNPLVYAAFLAAATSNPLAIIGAIIAAGLDASNVISCEAIAEKQSLESWGGKCGGLTNYYDDCENNCLTWCNGLHDGMSVMLLPVPFVDIKANAKTSCIESCKNTCEFNGIIHGIVNLINYLIGIVASIMFVIYGYKFITSSSPGERDEAKKGIMYVILAIFIVIVAESFVTLIMGDLDMSGGIGTLSSSCKLT